ncbi:MAG: hypothetical protein U1A78_39465 [Polyangia bacterium]
MSPPVAAPVVAEEAEAAVLARSLLRRAVSAFEKVPPDARGPALTALDGFLARPGPSTYLRAVRVVAEAHREWSVRQVRAARAGYALARGLATVRRELGPDAAEVLAVLPADDRAGLRLRALALLASAHRELAGRVAGSAEQLRRQLALAKERTAQGAPAAPPRRRPPPRPGRR